MITAGEGKYMVWLKKQELDKGLVLMLGGGEKSHLGGAAYVTPDGTEDTIAVEGHHDLEVLLPIAREACRKHNVPVLATGGVHVDNASKEEIKLLVRNCRELMKCI